MNKRQAGVERPGDFSPVDSRHAGAPRSGPLSRANSHSSESFSTQLHGFLRRNMTWFLVAGLLLLIIQDVFGTHGVLAMHHSEKQAAELHNQINQLDQENRKLQGRVERLKTDPAAIERIAREQMGLARPGEMIFPLAPQPGDSQSAPAQPTDPAAKKH
ncbi:MAG: septum formation initiator family protein [Candidatus Acidiferrales bacterium]